MTNYAQFIKLNVIRFHKSHFNFEHVEWPDKVFQANRARITVINSYRICTYII